MVNIGGICHTLRQYAKANNKYMKDYNKNVKSLCFQYWDVNNLYGSEMSQSVPVKNFKWVKEICKFDEVFIKIYNE